MRYMGPKYPSDGLNVTKNQLKNGIEKIFYGNNIWLPGLKFCARGFQFELKYPGFRHSANLMDSLAIFININ